MAGEDYDYGSGVPMSLVRQPPCRLRPAAPRCLLRPAARAPPRPDAGRLRAGQDQMVAEIVGGSDTTIFTVFYYAKMTTCACSAQRPRLVPVVPTCHGSRLTRRLRASFSPSC